MTRPEAMEQLTVMLNKARSTRKFAYDMWGEDSAHAIWDTEIALYEYLLAELGVSGNGTPLVATNVPLEGVVLPDRALIATAATVPEATPIRA